MLNVFEKILKPNSPPLLGIQSWANIYDMGNSEHDLD